MILHFMSHRRDDSGVALVMAMGVALIGILVAGIVITMVIVASNDSGRDRVRTTEIHSAEAAVDTTMAILQTITPCPSPAFSGTTYGSGVQATTVEVTIDYADDSGPLTCSTSSGSLGTLSGSGVPTRAVITATATSDRQQVGLQPVRTMEAEVDLTAIYSPNVKAAIFSASGMGTSAAFHLTPGNPAETADVWVDSGSWTCTGGKSQIRTVGSVYVVAGSFDVGNNCIVDGNVWVQQDLTTGAAADPKAITKSITVRSGDLTVNKALTIGGSALLGGPSDPDLTALGGIKFGQGAAAIQPNLTSVLLPQIKWDATTQAKWVAEGFSILSAADFGKRMDAALGTPAGTTNPCSTWATKEKGKSNTIVLPASKDQKAVYDLTTACKGTIKILNADIELQGDTAIILNGLDVTTSLNVTSTTGVHRLWIIVPYSGYAPGCGCLSSNSADIYFSPDVWTFLYAPGTVSMNPHGTFTGQIYGGTVNLKNDADMTYQNVGVPSGELEAATGTTVIGFEVELIHKNEPS